MDKGVPFMTHPTIRQFLLTPPAQLPQAQAFGLPLAHMACQISPEGRLTLAPLPPDVKGGLLLVGVPASPVGQTEARPAVRDILSLCQARGFGGVILDIEQPPTRFVGQLIQGLEEGLGKKTLFLPEAYGAYSRRAAVYLTSAISGGSLQRRLEDAVDAYGTDRLVLCLRRAREDFFLPSVKGQGQPISQERLEALRQRLNPAVFYSQDLCAHYFTYMSRETGAHFILFDTAESLAKKRALARGLGITKFFLLYPEVEAYLPALVGEAP